MRQVIPINTARVQNVIDTDIFTTNHYENKVITVRGLFVGVLPTRMLHINNRKQHMEGS